MKPLTPYVAVDPGSSCAWTAWRPVPGGAGGVPWWRWSSWRCLTEWRPSLAVTTLKLVAKELGVAPDALVVLVEGQFLGQNPQTMMHTVARRGHIECAADVCGARYLVVNPSAWQTVIRRPRDRGQLQRKTVKMRTKLLALGERCETGSAVGAPEDVGDSFAVGYYARQTAASIWAAPSALGVLEGTSR